MTTDTDDQCDCCGDCLPCWACGGCTGCLRHSPSDTDTELCGPCAGDEPITADDLHHLADEMRNQ